MRGIHWFFSKIQKGQLFHLRSVKRPAVRDSGLVGDWRYFYVSSKPCSKSPFLSTYFTSGIGFGIIICQILLGFFHDLLGKSDGVIRTVRGQMIPERDDHTYDLLLIGLHHA